MTLDVKSRTVGEQLVLTQEKTVTQEGVTPFLQHAIGHGWEIAPRFGGVIGPVFVVFDDDFNDGKASRVEVCHPVAMDQALPDDVPHRIDPEHVEAYVTLPKRLVQFPEILQGYDAVDAWIVEHGKTITGGAREIYFTDFMKANDDDLVTDIAFPIEG